MKYILTVAFLVIAVKCVAQHVDTMRYTEIRNSVRRTVVASANDTSYFIVECKNNKTSVKLNGKWTELRTNNELEDLMLANKNKIDAKKIVVVGSSKLPYAAYSFILDALKKSDRLVFYLSATD